MLFMKLVDLVDYVLLSLKWGGCQKNFSVLRREREDKKEEL